LIFFLYVRSNTTSPISHQHQQQQEAKTGETRNEELQYIFNQFDGKQAEGKEEVRSKQPVTYSVFAEQDSSTPTVEATTADTASATTTTSPTTEQDRRTSLAALQNANVDKPLPPPVDIPFDFNKFLWQMRRRQANPITKYFKR
jgi:hypothetical protein